jgi:predicted DNA binding CopG/RHH family protein
MKKEFIYDDEELEILDALDNDTSNFTPLTSQERDQYSQNAKYTKSLNQKRQTTIRFSVSDLATIKAKAKEMGIGYQNLIQALVHNYATGKIKLEA